MSDGKRPKPDGFSIRVIPTADGNVRVKVKRLKRRAKKAKKAKTAKKAKKAKKTKKAAKKS